MEMFQIECKIEGVKILLERVYQWFCGFLLNIIIICYLKAIIDHFQNNVILYPKAKNTIFRALRRWTV